MPPFRRDRFIRTCGEREGGTLNPGSLRRPLTPRSHCFETVAVSFCGLHIDGHGQHETTEKDNRRSRVLLETTRIIFFFFFFFVEKLYSSVFNSQDLCVRKRVDVWGLFSPTCTTGVCGRKPPCEKTGREVKELL